MGELGNFNLEIIVEKDEIRVKATTDLIHILNIDLNKTKGLIELDTDGILWVYQKDKDLWYSINGRRSSKSPIERINAYKECENRIAKQVEDIEIWSRLREAVLKRDNNTCQKCSIQLKSLDIHHIIPKSIGGANTYDNLISLCKKCHREVEFKDYPKKIRALIIEGLNKKDESW